MWPSDKANHEKFGIWNLGLESEIFYKKWLDSESYTRFFLVSDPPLLISKLLVASACLHAASDWPRTFYTQGVFVKISLQSDTSI